MWGSICHHVEREASRFILSMLRLCSEVPEAREILRNLVVGRIVFTPRPELRVYEFSGRVSFGRLLAGTTSPVSVVTPAGFDGCWNLQVRGIVRRRAA